MNYIHGMLSSVPDCSGSCVTGQPSHKGSSRQVTVRINKSLFCCLFIIMSETISEIATGVWTPILFLLILGGIFFFFYSRFIHYKYFAHTIAILRGKYHNPNDPGQISPYEALSTALASTVGMGNIAGVAAAISIGGPGALFWMWVTAFVGMSTNFFTSTLSVCLQGCDCKRGTDQRNSVSPTATSR